MAMQVDMKGWWCVWHGDALAWDQTPSAREALRRSLDLHRLGDWTDDVRKIVVFPRITARTMLGRTTTPALSSEPWGRRGRARLALFTHAP